MNSEVAVHTAPHQSVDIFDDLNSLRITPESNAANTEKLVVTVPVRKPSREAFVRVHPDLEKYGIDTQLLELKEMDSTTYLIVPQLRQVLASEPTVRLKRLRLTVDRQGNTFLWPVALPQSDGKIDPWNETALQAQEIATEKWTRVTSNRDSGCYDVRVANIPAEPQWPAQGFGDLLRIAFRERVIDNVDHPVLRKLRGES